MKSRFRYRRSRFKCMTLHFIEKKKLHLGGFTLSRRTSTRTGRKQIQLATAKLNFSLHKESDDSPSDSPPFPLILQN